MVHTLCVGFVIQSTRLYLQNMLLLDVLISFFVYWKCHGASLSHLEISFCYVVSGCSLVYVGGAAYLFCVVTFSLCSKFSGVGFRVSCFCCCAHDAR